MVKLSGKKILITGVTGFIGKNLLNVLTKHNTKEIRCLVRNKQDAIQLSSDGITTIIGDLRDFKQVSKATRGIDIIFNLASGLPHHHLQEKDYWDINVNGLENLIKSARESGVARVVHVSTVGIYGKAANNLDENSARLPSDPYTRSKVAGEEIVQRYGSIGVPFTIIRPTIAYGPYDTRPGFLDFFRLMQKGMFVRLGNGNNYFHTVYVKNLVDSLILVSYKKQAINQDFIIGDDPCPTMVNIWTVMSKEIGRSIPPFYIPQGIAYLAGFAFDISNKIGVPPLLSRRRVNFITEGKRYKIDKARKVLGYKPEFSLKEGLHETALWYKGNGLLR